MVNDKLEINKLKRKTDRYHKKNTPAELQTMRILIQINLLTSLFPEPSTRKTWSQKDWTLVLTNANSDYPHIRYTHLNSDSFPNRDDWIDHIRQIT